MPVLVCARPNDWRNPSELPVSALSLARAGAIEGAATLVIRPNRSLSVLGIVGLFLALSVPAIVIGVSLARAGAWLILPFSGIEIVGVGVLCGWLYRHYNDCELVVVGAQCVRVVQRTGTKERYQDFSRHWLRVELDRRDVRRPSQLHIGSHGNYIEIAKAVTDSDRVWLARELRNALRSA